MTLIAQTPRLKIATMSLDDTALLHQLTGDAAVMKYFPKVLTYDESAEMMRAILAHYERHGHCFWKLTHRVQGDFIGIAGILHQQIDGAVEAEISYRVASRYWNNGYATEAAKACMEHARAALGKTRLISLIRPENEPSLRVARKLGGVKEKSVSFVGMTHDVYVYPE